MRPEPVDGFRFEINGVDYSREVFAAFFMTEDGQRVDLRPRPKPIRLPTREDLEALRPLGISPEGPHA